MKKHLLTLFSVATLLVILSACSGSSPSKTEASKKSDTVSKTSKSEEKKPSSEVKASSKQPATASTDQFDLMIEAAQSQVPQLKEQFGATFSDLSIIKGEGHTIVYTYTYAQDPGITVDAAALKPTLVKGLKPTLDGVKAIASDAQIQVIYLKPDKSELANIMITQADTDAVS